MRTRPGEDCPRDDRSCERSRWSRRRLCRRVRERIGRVSRAGRQSGEARARSGRATARQQRSAPRPGEDAGVGVADGRRTRERWRNREGSDPRLAAALRPRNAAVRRPRIISRSRTSTSARDSRRAHTAGEPRARDEAADADAHEGLARIWRDWGFPALGAWARASRASISLRRSAQRGEHARDAARRARPVRRSAARRIAARAGARPGAGWALNNLCFVECGSDRLDEARAHCEAALDVDAWPRRPRTTTWRSRSRRPAISQRARRGFLAAGDPAAAAYNIGIVHMAEPRVHRRRPTPSRKRSGARPAFTAAKTRAHAARLKLLTDSR